MNKNILRNLSYLVLLIFSCSLFYKPLPKADIGWHLAVGKNIVNEKHVPHSDPFSFNEESKTWILKQWLGSTVLYTTYALGKEEGLKLLRVIIFLLTIITFVSYGRDKIPDYWIILLAICMSFGLSTRSLLRPFIFNFPFILFLLILIEQYRKNYKPVFLGIISIIVLIWGQLHLGSFVYGNFIIGIVVFSEIINYFIAANKTNPKKNIKGMFVLWVCFLAALGITPYGIQGFLYPYKVFLLPDYLNVYKYTFAIAENLPPNYVLTLKGIWAQLLIVITCVLLITNKKRSLADTLLYLTALMLFLMFRRASGFFTIITIYTILKQFSNQLWLEKLNNFLNVKKADILIYLFLITFMIFFTVHDINRVAHLENQNFKIKNLEYVPNHPISIVRLLKNNKVFGNVFCNEHIGSTIIFESYPQMRPFVDGRQLDPSRFDTFRKVLLNPSEEWERANSLYNFDLVILDAAIPASKNLINFLNDNMDWKIINVKNTFIAFAKAESNYRNTQIDDYEARLTKAFVTDNHIKIFTEMLNNENIEMPHFYMKPTVIYIDTLDEGITLNQLNYYYASIYDFLNASTVSPELVRRSLKLE